MATQKGVWNLQQVRDKELQDLWNYSAPGGDAGELYTWGYNALGSLGLNDTTQRSSPTQVPGTTWVQLGDGTGYSKNPLAVKSDGTLWTWGSDYYGSLGLNEESVKYSSPTQIPGTTWAYVACGQQSNAATKTDGTLWVWGRNEYGSTGSNNRTNYSSPIQIPGTDWAVDGANKLATGYLQTGAIKTDGTLWVWGYGTWGTLAQNTGGNPAHRSSPVQVPGTTWRSIKMGENNALATKTDGTLWGWGRNQHGELGLNADNPGISSPTQIPGTWSINVDIAAFSLLVASDGTLWGVGENSYGATGSGDRVKYSSPVQVGSDTTWSKVSVGRYESSAVKTDGTLWAWGDNDYGQLSQNNRTRYSSPTQIGSATNWVATVAGFETPNMGIRG